MNGGTKKILQWLTITILVVLALFSCLLNIIAPFQFVYALATGWAALAIERLPYASDHLKSAGVLLLAGLGMCALLHLLLKKAWNRTNGDSQGPWERRWTMGIVIVAIMLPLAGVAMAGIAAQVKVMATTDPPMTADKPSREAAFNIMCASNMRQLGQAVMLYAQAHEGKLPGSLLEIMRHEELDNNVLNCPTDVRHWLSNREGPEVRDAWIRMGNSSYVYHGRGLTNRLPTDYPLFTEVSTGHSGGMNICFGDGHVEMVPLKHVPAVLAQLDAGRGE